MVGWSDAAMEKIRAYSKKEYLLKIEDTFFRMVDRNVRSRSSSRFYWRRVRSNLREWLFKGKLSTWALLVIYSSKSSSSSV